jgi:anion transporter
MSAAAAKAHPHGPSRTAKAIATVLFCAGAILLLGPSVTALEPNATRALGLVLIAVGGWATEALPIHVTSFLFFAIALVFGIAPPDVVFSGFHAGAVWLVFGGVVLGLALHRTGLAARIAEAVLATFGASRKRLFFGVAMTAFGFAFVMPSAMSRVVLLIPIVTALADRVGYMPGTRGRDGLVIAAAFATVMAPMGILPATVPNLVMTGLIESIYGVTLKYGPFMLLNLTVAGSLALVATIVLSTAAYRDKEPARIERGERQPLSRQERLLTVVLLCTLILWATDALHGIAPAWVALGAAVFCLLPLTKLVPASALSQNVNYAPWFFVAGIIGLGAVVANTGLAKTLGALLIHVSGLAPGHDAYNFGAMMLVGASLSLFANAAGASAVLTPLAGDIAAATGWPMETAMLSQVLSFMVIFVPFQLAPVLTAMMLGGVTHGRMVRFCLAYTAVYIFLISPLNFLWWRYLGMFG